MAATGTAPIQISLAAIPPGAATDDLLIAILQANGSEFDYLRLAEFDSVRVGEPVVALGNPQGLKHSVVSGVVSGRRTLDGRSMIQLPTSLCLTSKLQLLSSAARLRSFCAIELPTPPTEDA